MKKLLLILSFSFLASAGFAQHIGVKGGATYSTFRGSGASEYNYRVGYTAGAFYQHHFHNVMGVQVEGLVTSKGASREAAPNVTDTYRLTYLDVPVLFHASTGGWFFDLGPQASFLLAGRQVRESTASAETTTTTRTNITDHPHTIDFGAVLGLGYRAPNGVGLEARYAPGLKRIDDEGPLAGSDRRNIPFSFMVSYMLR